MKRIMKFSALSGAILSVQLMIGGCGYYLGCDSEAPKIEEYYLMTLVNNSAVATVWVFPEHGDVDCGQAGSLPDELDTETGADVVIRLAAKKSTNIRIVDDGIKSAFETYHVDDSLPVYIFAEEDFDSIPWSQLKAEEKWLAKYSYTVEEMLNADKWIEYRP